MSAIKVNIKPGGETKVTVEGIAGTNCRVISKPIQDALAGAVVSDKDTADIYQQPATEGLSADLKH